MIQSLCYSTFLVKDYDEAIEFFTNKLQFVLIENTTLSKTKRWVLVSPNGNNKNCLLLAKASTSEQEKCIGNQAGGRVTFFLQTDDFENYYNLLKIKEVEFLENPRREKYGMVVVFKDLYGNKWDLLEEKKTI